MAQRSVANRADERRAAAAKGIVVAGASGRDAGTVPPVTSAATPRNFHAFFWSPHTYTCPNGETTPENSCDLGTLPGDVLSEALGINNRNEVVGISIGSTSYGQAFIYENGQMINLNDCVVQGTTLFLTDAQDINNHGAITGQAFDPGSNLIQAFVAIPVPDPSGNSPCQR